MLNQPPVGKTYSDTIATRTPYPLISESPELRCSFIRNTNSIFAILLLLIVAVGAIVVSYQPYLTSTTTRGGLAGYLLIIILPFLSLSPLYYHHQRHVSNYVLIGMFTVALAFTAGVSCTFTSGKHVTPGYFYLSESLDENDGYTFRISIDEQDFKYVSLQALPNILNHSYGGPITLYHGLGRNQCINPHSPASSLGLLESFFSHNVKLEDQESFEGTHPNTRYIMKKRFDRGGYGEVWVAFHWNYHQQSNNSEQSVNNKAFQLYSTYHVTENETSGPPNDNIFIVKRIMVERRNTAYLSGIREKYFGELFLDASSYSGGTLSVKHPYPYPYEEGLKHIARYIESFGSKSKEIWLVFRHEGISLSKLLYTADDNGSSGATAYVTMLHPSKWWRWLKTTKAGEAEMKSLILQLDSGRCLKRSTGDETYITKMRIIDFGSAMDEFTIKHLYGAAGPSRDEQTVEYMPPEAFLNATWYHGPSSITTKYDMWSVGVVILELVIGSRNVFQIDGRTHALLDRHLEGWNEELKKLAYKLKSLMELCILPPRSSANGKVSERLGYEISTPTIGLGSSFKAIGYIWWFRSGRTYIQYNQSGGYGFDTVVFPTTKRTVVVMEESSNEMDGVKEVMGSNRNMQKE
ncbi:hypothetical protein SSX86_027807 [Deinandra increscens subsp. villosa]|uniref:Protein kinase domain-containing protein n=1 Tax=Deinandra increscens subsp. villosa TaxID=3103831 RepID=A0AAP0GJ28_9ASTR